MTQIRIFSRIPPALQVMAGAILISFSGVYVKLSKTGPTTSGFYRVFWGGLILFFLSCLISKRSSDNNPRTFSLFFIAGLFFALDLFTWHISIHYVGPGLATILANFQVFFLALIGVLFMGEKITPKLVSTIPIAVIGLFMVVGIKWEVLNTNYKIGVLLGLATALCYTGYILTLRVIQSLEVSPSPVFSLSMVSFITAIFLAGLAWFQNESLSIPDLQSAVYLIAYASSSQVLGWLLIMSGLASIRASMAGLLLLLQPSLAFVWDVLLFDKATTVTSLIGTVITLTAIYLGSTSRQPSNSS